MAAGARAAEALGGALRRAAGPRAKLAWTVCLGLGRIISSR